jgi:hypothetical protein
MSQKTLLLSRFAQLFPLIILPNLSSLGVLRASVRNLSLGVNP